MYNNWFILLVFVSIYWLLCVIFQSLYGQVKMVRRVIKRSVEVKLTEEYEDGSSEWKSVEAIGNETLDVLGKLAKRKLLENKTR